MDKEAEISLLKAMTLLQSVVLSCVDRKRFQFTRTQQSILTVLSMEGETTMKQIAKYIVSSQEQATRAVAPLVDAGYVERRTDPTNRTRVYIRLTDEGRDLLTMYWGFITENLSGKLDASLSDEEKTALCDAATGMSALLEKLK